MILALPSFCNGSNAKGFNETEYVIPLADEHRERLRTACWKERGRVMEERDTTVSTQDRHGRVIPRGRVKAAVSDALRPGASAIEETGGEKHEQSGVTSGGRQASVRLNRSADDVDHLDLSQVKTNIQSWVRTHPGISPLIAGTAGLIIGSLVRRRWQG
jgi:hypothetical protein